ncbi:SDR family NAD(P)-dependent oxidoreductase [Streptomyces sp. NPDC091682]|uniref:SDR family NAD(P)-dependent oxidoreductase n=1 Tax=Streptomyces sp. NPDC091682 TaxID=3366005 RepID=UPI0038081842
MEPLTVTGPLSVTRVETDAFARASGDLNPLHVDEAYASRTPFGEPVAHGVLCVLKALAAGPARPGMRLAGLKVRFPGPVIPGQRYACEVVAAGPDAARYRILDGRRVLLDAEITYVPGALRSAPSRAARARAFDTAAQTPLEQLVVGTAIGSAYRPDRARLKELLAEVGLNDHGIDVEHAAALAWASQLAGMEAPGRSALISSIELTCEETTASRGFAAKGEIADVDIRFRSVRLTGEVAAGRLRARVEICAFARREVPAPSPAQIRARVTPGSLDGRVAFVAGGSRGLGAALVQALAVAGCTVHVAFRHGRAEAEALADSLGPDAGRIRLHQGDVGDPSWCEQVRDRIHAQDGSIDLLLLNAGPAAQGMDLHTATVARAGEHVRRALELAQAPLSSFAEDLAAAAGRIVAISSAYAGEPRRGLAHYAAGKSAVEGLVRAAAAEYSGVRVLIARPPRLATSFADSVAAADEALPVEPVAAAIVGRLAAGPSDTVVELLHEFDEFTGRTHAAPEQDTAVRLVPATAAPVTDSTGRGLLAVAATFTTDPLRELLTRWSERLGLGLEVYLTPYGQVFQELLDPRSTFSANPHGCNAVLIRLEDWPQGAEGTRTVDEFTAAATACARRIAVPLAVVVCPASPPAVAARAGELAHLEERLRGALGPVDGIHVTGSDRWSSGFRVDGHHDAAREEHAHLPYTPLALTALATTVARTVHSLLAPPYKVLVLDCDNTLWGGVCGEDGPDGIRLGDAHLALQRWAVERHDQGVLICLSSKNSEHDVDEVFRHHPEMPLRPEHIAARRIDWNPKPGNIAALAAELGLGLDSVVFLDDNPVETAAVRASCPDVLALTLPSDEAEVSGFLDRLWTFDRPAVTDEDRRRTSMYRAGRERAQLRGSAATLGEFIAGLRLRIDVREARPEQLARVAQLTQRTNQFNLSGIRRTEQELKALLADGARCWVAEVGDRFGEYGLVGAAVTRAGEDAVVLETFLLSCRVLGRGVEHAFLSAVAAASVGDAAMLEAVYRPTARNTPVRTFFETVLGTGTPAAEDTTVWRVPRDAAAQAVFRPEDHTASTDPGRHATAPAKPSARSADPVRQAALTSLAADLTGAEELHRWIGGAPGSVGRHEPGRTAGTALEALCEVLARLRGIPADSMSADTTLASLRLESLEIVDATVALEKRYGRLPATLFFEHRTLGRLAEALQPDTATAPALATAGADTEPEVIEPEEIEAAGTAPGDIAVVGIAGRYPGASDIAQLWRNLLAGTESISDAAERWGGPSVVDPAGGPAKTYTSAAGLIEGVDEFDAPFFGLAPSEAETMDPQQRLFLQAAYHALEDAGHTAADLGRDVGVYVASMGPDYAVLSANAALDGRSRYPNSDLYQIANRVSHFFDFTGPSLAVDTACSGSGVALQLACDAIRSGTVTAALAGGVNLILHPARRIQYAQLGMVSRTGRCRPFGAGADGMIPSEGVGAVLLRPLRDALADGDHVYGVIKAIGANSGGRTNGFTVPSPEAQATLISATLRRAAVDPATIGYVEAHGTGTPLGDPIEIRGLTQAFGDTVRPGSVPVGSLKGNIGHTEAAAAVAGLTKVLLQLRHGTLVPSLHAEETNPHIDFERTPFRVQRETAEWRHDHQGVRRRAALSSFGAGGVNVHAVLEEAPDPAQQRPAPAGPELILLSAHDEEQLREVCTRLAGWVRAEEGRNPLGDIAHTLRAGREHFGCRIAFLAAGPGDLAETLDRLHSDPGGIEAAAAAVEAVSFGRVAAAPALAEVFDGGTESVRLLEDLARRSGPAALGRLWCQGVRVDWPSVLPGTGQRRVPLPGYPFRRARHWLEEPPSAVSEASTVSSMPAMPAGLGSPGETAYYAPHWLPEPALTDGLPAGATVVAIGATPQWAVGADLLLAGPDGIPEPAAGEQHLIVVDRRCLDTDGGTGTTSLDAALAAARLAVRGRHVTYVCLCRPTEEDPGSAAVTGFGRALAQESPLFRTVRIEVARDSAEPTLAETLAEARSGPAEVRKDGGVRLVRRWLPLAAGHGDRVLRDGGHYLITGGAGGVGRLLAARLAERCRASVTLLGRSPAPAAIDRLRTDVRAHGGEVLYIQADVTDARQTAEALARARQQHGPLRGVVHAAGVLRDGSFRDKSGERIREVLAPKVTGCEVLDEATSDDDLDFFLLMSSFVGTFGNAGQAEYCAANRFLDAFAEQRSARTARGLRSGRSVSAVWPLWEDGGMRMPAAARQLTATTLGLTAIGRDAALRAFEDVLGLDSTTVLIGCGDQERIAGALTALTPATAPAAPHLHADHGPGPADDRPAVLLERLRDEAARLVKLPVRQIDVTAEFGDFGFNSLLFTDFANRLNQLFALTLTPVIFFEFPNLTALAEELGRRGAAVARTEPAGSGADTGPESAKAAAPVAAGAPVSGPERAIPVAVTGMAGRFPGSAGLDAYWGHLMAGRDLVTEAPEGRWTGTRPRGGFLEDVLAFDAAFFGISPREARLMDPQQRLFLEAAWHALEDSGHDPRRLGGSRTGVFVGATLSDYSELLARSGEETAGHSVTGHVQSIIANRLSYLLDLRGPSEVLDTACSSSLTALHRALSALETGECDLAVVGGVNALFSPSWFESLGKAGMLSATGRCWTFDERADGFIRGEGAGVVILKRLDRALRDRDPVRAVIRGSAVNHGGRAHSLTAPNPEAQAEAVSAALRRAGAHPRAVSLIETHGTGTRLGDPIEVAGLRTAFSRLGAPGGPPWCALGAVKAGIGHLESAAGMAGLIKVLLAIGHRTLPPNAAGDRPNPHLELDRGPFRLPLASEAWEPTDETGAPLPLLAGVSAFGFGGANAHVIVGEPPAEAAPDRDPADHPGNPEVVVLSTATPERLREYARGLRDSLSGSEYRLADLAHTSRVARTLLPVRLAAVASNRGELVSQLDAFLAGLDTPGLYTVHGEPSPASGADASGPHALARRWAAGEEVIWPTAPGRRRVPFPVYPFDHSTPHGPSLGGDDMTATQPEAAHLPQLLTRSWVPAPSANPVRAPHGPCVLLLGRDTGVGLLEELAGLDTVDWIVLRESSTLPSLGAHEYELDLDDHGAGVRAAREITARHGHPAAVVDLVDAFGGPALGREAARVGLLQALAGNGRTEELAVAHVRRTARLGGARMAGLVRAVGSECGAVRAVGLEVEEAQEVLGAAVRELGTAGEESEVRYIGGVRHVRRMRTTGNGRTTAPGGLGGMPVDPGRAYLITGGTGGLGLAAAELLVRRGARRLALAGRRPLPLDGSGEGGWGRERTAAVRRLEEAGAEVLLHTGSLTDEAALAGFLEQVRSRFGGIAGVLHCAGSVSPTPAFVHKGFAEIADCWEPKGAGLLALDRALAQDEPDFVVLYSSLSATVPALAGGLSDYAAANALLDAFAEERAGLAWSRGSRTRYLAIGWGSWAGLGMGEVTSPRYRQAGLGALTREQGLTLLDQALAATGHTSLVAVAALPGAAEQLLGGANAAVGTAPGAGIGADAADAAPTPVPSAGLAERCAEYLTEVLAEATLLDRAAIRPEIPFADLGVDSVLIAGLVPRLEAVTGAPVDPSVILEHPTVARLAAHLAERHHDALARWAGTLPAQATADPRPAAGRPVRSSPSDAAPPVVPMAVVGMAGRFPGAATTGEFWELLRNGRSGVREVPRSRWDVASLYSPEPREGRSISKWGGFLDGVEEFDPGYFGIPETDAAHMDPLTRLFLECAEQTFADAGYTAAELAGRRIGVYVGSGTSSYASRITRPGRATATGLNQNFIAAHLAHVRDLRGPNLVVDTACSSSLTSLHLACQALRLGDCEMALVGGADLILDETPYLSLSASGALSPDGACHVFDAAANGFVPGEGVGAVLLKPLPAALADGDRVLAVIESTAVNNDGRTMGLTTPNPEAQRDVVREALAQAAADAGSVSYIEAHGTGTMIGDPIELKALTEVFRESTAERGFCAVGSVKSNVGHLLMAAGMASLQKVVLSLVHRALPPTLHCEHPNPRFVFESSPFRPNTELRDWPARQGVRRAGISAFGFGGTNCHVLVRELTAAERETHEAMRVPLPPPVFHRTRHWVERPRPGHPAPQPRPLFELEDLS